MKILAQKHIEAPAMTKSRATDILRRPTVLGPSASPRQREVYDQPVVEVEWWDGKTRRVVRRYLKENPKDPWGELVGEVLVLKKRGELS